MAKVTSVSALRELVAQGKDLTQAQEIYLSVLNNTGLTRQEIAATTGISINAVCGRVAELLSSKRAKVGITRACSITGKQVETIYALA